jgi:hypothetical protein
VIPIGLNRAELTRNARLSVMAGIATIIVVAASPLHGAQASGRRSCPPESNATRVHKLHLGCFQARVGIKTYPQGNVTNPSIHGDRLRGRWLEGRVHFRMRHDPYVCPRNPSHATSSANAAGQATGVPEASPVALRSSALRRAMRLILPPIAERCVMRPRGQGRPGEGTQGWLHVRGAFGAVAV